MHTAGHSEDKRKKNLILSHSLSLRRANQQMNSFRIYENFGLLSVLNKHNELRGSSSSPSDFIMHFQEFIAIKRQKEITRISFY